MLYRIFDNIEIIKALCSWIPVIVIVVIALNLSQ